MKFVLSWDIAPGGYSGSIQKFLSTGAPTPEGLTMLGRWHAPGSAQGWLLVETDDVEPLTQFMAEWNVLLDLRATLVIEDDEAAAGIKKAV